MVEKYNIILWDFDGVILDSMPIRDLGFVKVLEQEGHREDDIDALLAYHRMNGGLSRYVKFRYFYEQILHTSVTDEEILRLANLFSSIMLNLLVDSKLLILDAVSFIRANASKYRFHIVSGSDGAELNKICDGLGLTSYFHSIEGSPTPKKELVANLIRKYKYSLSEICLIGDSINDYEAAEVNGIDFLGYNNPDLITRSYYINTFNPSR